MKKLKNSGVIFNSKKGFTMVELLCVIVILGVLAIVSITGVSRLISKSREEKTNQNERTVSMAAESYLQANKSVLPKSIGQVTKIPIKDLYDAKFITSEVENSSGENCMTESYVRVYKYSKTGYTYTPYIYCGNETVPEDEEVPSPTGSVKFVENGKGNEEIPADFNNVRNAAVLFTFDGGTNTDGSLLAIESYNFSISVKVKSDIDGQGDDQLREIYNSGTMSGNNEPHLAPKVVLNDYIDVSTVTEFYVRYSVRNVAGGMFESTSSLGDEQGTYHDTVPPTCEGITGEAPDDNTWISLKSKGEKSRTISVVCNDSGLKQSGCVRTNYSKTWPNEKEKSVEYAYITVKDNAGNPNKKDCEHGSAGCCKVRVNVDAVVPTVKVKAYKSDRNGSPVGGNILKKSFEANTDNETIHRIESDGYNSTTNGWFNGKDYPDGVIYELTLSDDLHLAGYTWDTNEPNILSTSLTYTKVGVGSDGNISNREIFKNKQNQEQVAYVRFTEDGYRYGVLKVYDFAGNYTTVNISANLDKVAPPNPETGTSDLTLVKGDNSNYSVGTWSKDSIKGSYNVIKLKKDNINNNNTELSGFDKFTTTIKKANNQSYDVSGDTFNLKPSSSSDKSFDGTNSLYVKSCDKAGNCTGNSSTIQIKIDTTPPSCTTKIKNPISKEYYGLNDANPIVIGECTDSGGDNASGCKSPGYIEHEFVVDKGKNLVKDGNAGPGDNGKAGNVSDNAGNTATCSANQTIKIDHTKPKCIVSESDDWTKNDRTVYYKCSDAENNASGCPKTNANPTNPASGGYQEKWTESKKKVIVSKFEIKDKAGNATDCPKKTLDVYVDKTAPYYLKGGTVSVGSITAATYKDRFDDAETGRNNDDLKVEGSGVKQVQYCFTTGTSSDCSWGTSRSGPNDSCNKTVNVYTRAKDNEGNVSSAKKMGHYKTNNCCSDEHPDKCPWVTACREGNTKIYTTSAHNYEAGYLQHHLKGSSDRVYVLETVGSYTKVYPVSVARKYGVYPSSNFVWIYTNCLGPENQVCPWEQCKG